MVSTVTAKGQITIPVLLRKQYKIQPNDRVDFIADGDRIVLVPVKTLRDYRGAVRGGGTPEQERQAAREAVTRRIVEETT